MREVSVEFAKTLFERQGLIGQAGRILEIGGTPQVYYQLDGRKHLSLRHKIRNALVKGLGGEPRIKHPIITRDNPLVELFPGLEFLDRGFNQQQLGTDQDYTVDFTIDEQVAPLYNTFDAALSFDTLEHVNDPPTFCRNMLRIVKPGGWVYLQTVFAYQYHPSPEDYYRFSPMGLSECFKNAPGTIIECDWEDFNVAPYIFLRRLAD